VNKAYQPEMGARPIRRIVEQELEDPLAEMFLRDSNFKGRFIVHLDENDKLIFKKEEEGETNLATTSIDKEAIS
jgi:ATP-dependent Clp protease ATP-binding subunit ClpC